VARDGVLLPFLTLREADWIGLEGLPVSQGRITSPGLVTEALTIRGALAAAGADLRGTLRHAGAAGWEWVAGGKRLALSSPPQPGELTRLARFQRGFPEAWAKARALDLRYADRVVVSR
jgi:hypothetical protein